MTTWDEIVEIATATHELCRSRWLRIWDPGGAIKPEPLAGPGVYGGGMVIETDRGSYQIGGASRDVEYKLEAFGIAVWPERPVDPENKGERWHRSQRREVTAFPPDLDLAAIWSSPARRASFFLEDEMVFAILIEAEDRRMLFWNTESEVPCAVWVTSDRAEIARLLDGREPTEFPG